MKQSTRDIVEPMAVAGGIFVLGWLLVRKSARARAQEEQPFQIEPAVQPPPELEAPVQLNGSAGCAPCAAAAATRGFYY